MMWLLLLGGDALSESNDTLNLYTEEFPPYNYRNGENIVGVNHDIVMAMCERANIKCKVTLLPWSRAIRRAQTEVNAGIYSAARRKDRESDWQWVGPLLSSQVCLYKSKTRTDIVINTREDLSKYMLGVSKSFAYPDKLTELGFIEKINKITFRDLKSKMAGVDHNRVDLMLGSVNTMALQLKLLNKKVNEFTPVWELELPENIGNYLALNKGVALNIINRLNASFNTMQELGLLQEIKQKYIDTSASNNMQAPEELKDCAEFPVLSL
jgi:polar amino acid transport system substrate-binding protein